MAEIVKSVSNPGSTSNSKVEGIVTEALTPQFEEIITEDGILCLILSFLTMIEAVRTSVLSFRWRHIWTRLTILDFNAVSVLDARSLRDHHLSTEEAYTLTMGRTTEFIQSVNSVLQQLQGARVDKFEVADFPKDSRKFIHLRHLAWELDNKVKMIPLHLATLISVAPFLEEMELHLSESVFEQPPQAPSNTEMLPRHPHTHLKTIQVSGFYFDKWQIEIVAYLLNNATELKSMMIKKGNNPSRSVSKEINEAGMEILHQGVPVNVKLVVS